MPRSSPSITRPTGRRRPARSSPSAGSPARAIWFSHRWADRLNRNGSRDWSAWDCELVEKVSAEHGIDKEILETISDRRHNWLRELFESFAVSYTPTEEAEARAYERVVTTIRALAGAGHAIIVGRGGFYITQGMPGGIHLRLAVPLEYRVHHLAERDKISIQEAATRIAEIERNRDDFFRHYWPNRSLLPENYTLTLNIATLSIDEMVECVLPAIRAYHPTRGPARWESEPRCTGQDRACRRQALGLNGCAWLFGAYSRTVPYALTARVASMAWSNPVTS